MARTELQHAWQLRRARRLAYHAEGRGRPASAVTLNRLAADEADLADLLDRAASEDSVSAFELRRLAQETRDLAGHPDAAGNRIADTGDRPADILALAERLVEDYLEVGDRSADEAVVARAQGLAERAVLRLAQLRVLGAALPDSALSGRNPPA
ncbi:hypothetical protein [Ferrovibrio sp.]|uniref:hypothetical protein n=1 Tax=Ferrovibrio sp. TaxID=1917215 RepID=UPI0025BD0070|nr:hypothetical protein [Ferrovibrio sp.]